MSTMFGLFFFMVAAMVIMGFISTTILFARHSRIVSNIFQKASQQIDQELEIRERENPGQRTCGHCGTVVEAVADCPNCGAPLETA